MVSSQTVDPSTVEVMVDMSLERVVSAANTVFHEPITTIDSFLARSGQKIPTRSIEEQGLILMGECLLAGQPMVELTILLANISIFVVLANCDPAELDRISRWKAQRVGKWK